MNIKIAILTVSDRSAKGERQDLSAPELARFCEGRQWEVTEKAVVSDEVTDISVMLKKWADSEKVECHPYNRRNWLCPPRCNSRGDERSH